MINTTNSEFFSEKPEYIIQTLELYHREAAVVSRELMVLRQTEKCKDILADGMFYPLEDWLDVRICNMIKDAFEMNEPQTASVDIDGLQRMLRIIPIKDVALLLFDPIQKRTPALLMDAIKMRESAANLMNTANMISDPAVAAKIKLEVMRLLRQASHCEILGGGGSIRKTVCDLGKIVQNTAQQLRQRGFDAKAECARGLLIAADSSLIHSAVLTLASNSIRFGGNDVKIIIKAVKNDNDFIIRVDDNGPGISSSAVLQKSTGWSDPDSSMLERDWGMGIPFAEQIAKMHGGRLHYLFGTTGSSACMVLPELGEEAFETSSIYSDIQIEPADIELSTVLSADAYMEHKPCKYERT